MKKIIGLTFFVIVILLQSRTSLCAPVNVALGATVTASHSSVGSLPPSNLVDGNRNTINQIYATTTSGWWEFDLGSQKTVAWLNFVGWGSPGNGYNYTMTHYKIYYRPTISDSWIEIIDYTGPIQTDSPYINEHILPAPVTGQYFRFENYQSQYRHPAWNELELYDSLAIPEPATMILLGTGLIGVALRRRKK